jgi:hypothetical protein
MKLKTSRPYLGLLNTQPVCVDLYVCASLFFCVVFMLNIPDIFFEPRTSAPPQLFADGLLLADEVLYSPFNSRGQAKPIMHVDVDYTKQP